MSFASNSRCLLRERRLGSSFSTSEVLSRRTLSTMAVQESSQLSSKCQKGAQGSAPSLPGDSPRLIVSVCLGWMMQLKYRILVASSEMLWPHKRCSNLEVFIKQMNIFQKRKQTYKQPPGADGTNSPQRTSCYPFIRQTRGSRYCKPFQACCLPLGQNFCHPNTPESSLDASEKTLCDIQHSPLTITEPSTVSYTEVGSVERTSVPTESSGE